MMKIVLFAGKIWVTSIIVSTFSRDPIDVLRYPTDDGWVVSCKCCELGI